VSLAEYQRALAAAISPDDRDGGRVTGARTDDVVAHDAATVVVREAIVEWAQHELAMVCPIVTGLLSFDERLTSEVQAQLRRRDRPMSIHTWGVQFASRLSSDPDPWISWAAQVDAATLVAAESWRPDDPVCPGDPMRAMLLIASGADPRSE
jgi:hypothetical protein